MSRKDILRKAIISLHRSFDENGSVAHSLLPDGKIKVLHNTFFNLSYGEYDRFLLTIECTDEGIYYETFLPNERSNSRYTQRNVGLTPFIVPENKVNAVAHYISEQTYNIHVMPTMYLNLDSRQVRSRFFWRIREENTDVTNSIFAERSTYYLLFYHGERIRGICES